jgi:membrane peptidoglycan carboxypeptidase
VGRAGVPGSGSGAPGQDDGFGGFGGDRPGGRATVGSAAVGAAAAGRARVGQAPVRPVSPGGPGGYGPGGNGPGGPGGPGGRGGRGGTGDPDALRKAKQRKRLNWIIASFAVLIMLAGVGVVAGTYYSTTVVLPDQINLPLSTTIYANDGKTVVAKLGEQNRQFVTINQIPKYVQHAVASAEDRKFYEHSGIDYAGIARAAWNNFTGGSKQGASTITQQYARNAYDNLKDDTYARKVKEAILASKLNDKYSKDEIMQHYLNTIYFGRGAYGIEAAAQAYFAKSADKLTVAEGAVLAALIKQPVPGPGHKGYDPADNPEGAKDRWDYVIKGMVEKGWLAPADVPTAYPKLPKVVGKDLDFGVNTPLGNVLNYVRDEMVQKGLCDPTTCSKTLKDGGFKITTTINVKMQQAAEATVQRAKKGSELEGQPQNLMAALVAIDPQTGRVLAYYGGDKGTGTDYAGKNTDNGVEYGGHPPGSSFKVYTLAAGLAAGQSLQSYWKSTPFIVPGTKIKVGNAGAKSTSCKDSCTLEQSTLKSYNVPFYYLTEKIGADKVVEMARNAGITEMWSTSDNPPKAYDLTKVKSGKDVAPAPFFNVVGYGQYPITVLDHANGVATFAARGKYNKAHFVLSVERQNIDTGKWEKKGGEQLKPQQRISKEVADNVTKVLQKYPAQVSHTLDNGRVAASKTGTWELNETSLDNAHAWMVGYTPQLATAVWVGNAGAKQTALRLKDGTKVQGGNLPGDIWQRFMDEALKGQEKQDFPKDVPYIGDPDLGNGTSPAPAAPTQPACNPLDIFCTNPGGGNGNGNGNGRGGGGALPTLSPAAPR